MLLVRLGLLLQRAFLRILDGQGGDDDEDLAGAAETIGLDEHPAQPRIDRQPGEGPPDPGQLLPAARGRVVVPDRAEFVEEPDAVGDLPGSGRVDEREAPDRPEPEADHLEDDRSERGAEDLGFGEGGPGVVVVPGIQPDADAVREATAAAGALPSASPG